MKGEVSMGRAFAWVFAIVISIVMIFLINSMTWLFPSEMIMLLNYLIGFLMVMSILIVW